MWEVESRNGDKIQNNLQDELLAEVEKETQTETEDQRGLKVGS